MKIKGLLAGILTVGMLFGSLAGCGSPANGGEGDESVSPSPSAGDGVTETVSIVSSNNGWDSQMLHNEIAKLVVEHAYDGYEMSFSTASSNLNWLAMIEGDVDLDIESWTDNVASYPEDLAEGRVVDLGVLVPDSAQGIYVPRYVIEGDAERGIEAMAPELRTVEDLKHYADVFPDDEDPSMGRLYGSIPGWMADEILYKKYEFYELDDRYNYTRLGSEATLFASLVSAYNAGEAWVGYCYEPTWVTGKLDLIKLEDAPYDEMLYQNGQCEFPSQELRVISSSMFAEKAPDLVEFFSNYQTGSALISEGLAYLDENGVSHEAAAIWLLKEHDEIIDEWLPAENAAKLRTYLSTM